MKKLYSFLFVLMLFAFMPILNVSAAVDDTEQIIELDRNDKINSSMPLIRHDTSVTDETDSRIYKVLLGMNSTEKLTILSKKTFDIEITDENGFTIVQRTGIGRDGFYSSGVAQVEFNTNYIGYYYIYVTPLNDGNNTYPYSMGVIVGEPLYHNLNPTHRVDLNTSSMTSSAGSSIQNFSLSNVSSIPDHAILTNISIGGTETNRNLVDITSIKRSIRPSSTNKWIETTFPLYDADRLDNVPKHAQIRVKQSYAFKHSATFSYSGTYSLKPFVLISYKQEVK